MSVDLLVFSSSHCPPCLTMEVTGVYDEIKRAGFAIEKVDAQANPALAEKFGVRAVPTLIVRKNGEHMSRLVGGMDAATLLAELRRFED